MTSSSTGPIDVVDVIPLTVYSLRTKLLLMMYPHQLHWYSVPLVFYISLLLARKKTQACQVVQNWPPKVIGIFFFNPFTGFKYFYCVNALLVLKYHGYTISRNNGVNLTLPHLTVAKVRCSPVSNTFGPLQGWPIFEYLVTQAHTPQVTLQLKPSQSWV